MACSAICWTTCPVSAVPVATLPSASRSFAVSADIVVDVMQNGMTIGDISSTSGDHTNTMSLFDTERVEVLKGPAALRYGAYAATGVVNGFNRHLNADTDEGTDVLFGFGDNADETITAGVFTPARTVQPVGLLTRCRQHHHSDKWRVQRLIMNVNASMNRKEPKLCLSGIYG